MAKIISLVLLFSTIFIVNIEGYGYGPFAKGQGVIGQVTSPGWRQLSSCQVDFPAASGHNGDKICGACIGNGNKDCGGSCLQAWEYSYGDETNKEIYATGNNRKIYWTLCSNAPCTLKLKNFNFNGGTFVTEYSDRVCYCERTFMFDTDITFVHATCCQSQSN